MEDGTGGYHLVLQEDGIGSGLWYWMSMVLMVLERVGTVLEVQEGDGTGGRWHCTRVASCCVRGVTAADIRVGAAQTVNLCMSTVTNLEGRLSVFIPHKILVGPNLL